MRSDLACVDPEQRCKLARMRSEDRRRAALERLEAPEGVGVEDDRDLEPLEEDSHELAKLAAAAHTTPEGFRLLFGHLAAQQVPSIAPAALSITS